MSTTSAPGALGTAQWAEFLSKELGCVVLVRFGRARTTVLQSKKQKDGTLLLRMSSFLAHAPGDVRGSVADWLRAGRRKRGALAPLHRWLDEDLPRLAGGEPRAHRIRFCGRFHDLEDIASPLWNASFPDAFVDSTRPALTWGRPQKRTARRSRSLRLGSYNARSNLVRIHPTLDQDFVPAWFVRYILFHELLHAQLGFQRNGNRRIVHGTEFRRRERLYGDYQRAIAWEKTHLGRLLANNRARSSRMA